MVTDQTKNNQEKNVNATRTILRAERKGRTYLEISSLYIPPGIRAGPSNSIANLIMKHILNSDKDSLPHGSSSDIPSISEFIKWKKKPWW